MNPVQTPYQSNLGAPRPEGMPNFSATHPYTLAPYPVLDLEQTHPVPVTICSDGKDFSPLLSVPDILHCLALSEFYQKLFVHQWENARFFRLDNSRDFFNPANLYEFIEYYSMLDILPSPPNTQQANYQAEALIFCYDVIASNYRWLYFKNIIPQKSVVGISYTRLIDMQSVSLNVLITP